MKLNQSTPTTKPKKKRLGRGYGSGKGGHTATRGSKGQKARSKLPLYFEGTAMRKSLIRRLPMLRGKSKLKSFQKKPLILNLKYLSLLPKNTRVNIANLIKHGLVPESAKKLKVKLLGDGDLKAAYIVELPISKAAAKKIIKAGGKVIKSTPKPKSKSALKSKPKK